HLQNTQRVNEKTFEKRSKTFESSFGFKPIRSANLFLTIERSILVCDRFVKKKTSPSTNRIVSVDESLIQKASATPPMGVLIRFCGCGGLDSTAGNAESRASALGLE
ncbi:MAG: hypothetical protein ACPGN3_17405, partial [Opitutales bacterium]